MYLRLRVRVLRETQDRGYTCQLAILFSGITIGRLLVTFLISILSARLVVCCTCIISASSG
jgi:hypothetical protein